MGKLFIDFDGIYEKTVPDPEITVITNKYNAEWVLNVINLTSREYIYNLLEAICDDISQVDSATDLNINTNKIYWFNYFFSPLGQWFAAIENLILTNKITCDTEVEFSTYSNNSKVFIFEAEGENNGQILYKRSYFLSYYIKAFLVSKGLTKFSYKKDYTLRATVSFYLRGPLVLTIKLLQLILYKLFVIKRSYNINNKEFNDPLVALSSRGIIQTQFIDGFYNYTPKNLLPIINESSNKPFRNLSVSKNTFKSFFYAEGYLSFSTLIKEYFFVLKNYKTKKCLLKDFWGVEINFYNLMPEINVKLFHLKTYAESLNNAIKHLEKIADLKVSKIISFEMLPPFSHYIKLGTNVPVIQIQTTALYTAKYPDFVYSDMFYFTDYSVYNKQLEINSHMKHKFRLLNNLKFWDIKKQEVKTEFKTLTYFTQPIYYDEEKALIEFLKEFCVKNEMLLQIKLHPRSPMLRDNTGIEILGGNISSQEAILGSDLVVTRTSSIGLDSWYANTPVLFFVNGLLKQDNVSYIPEDYLGAINNNITVEILKLKLNDIVADFYSHSYHKNLKIDKEVILEEIFRENYTRN